MARMYPQAGGGKPCRVMPRLRSMNVIGLLLLGLLTFLSGSLLAQSGRTTISGRVVDPTGAVVPGAKVVVTNVETNFSVSLDTNDKGYYEASQLIPGQYKVTAEAAGFGKLVRQGITLVAGTPISIELKLTVGKTQEVLVVTADAPLLNTEPASGGQVLGSDTIANAPVSGANASLLLKYAQGVYSSDASNRYMAGNLNATGNVSNIGTAGTVTRNEFYLDGASNTGGGHNIAYNPSTDEVNEMKTETLGLDASMGKTLGVSVIATSKGGTNDFHGMVRDMYYARRWQAMSHFASANAQIQIPRACDADPTSAACAQAKQKYGNPGVHENNGGVNFGGPVIIPKIFNGKDKLFFFVNLTRDDYADAQYNTFTVPTAQQRLGDFSDLCAGAAGTNCGAYQIYDPFSIQPDPSKPGRYIRTAVPGNNLNNVPRLATLMANNPYANWIQKYWALPNIADGNGSYAHTNNYGMTQVTPQLYKSYLLRLDFTPSQKDRYFLRLSKTWYYQDQQYGLIDRLDSRYQENGSNLLTGGWTHMFSNSAVLDTSLGFTERWDNRWYPNTAQFAPSTIGLPSYMDNMVNRTYQNQLPNLTISGLSNWLGNPSPMSITRNISLRSGLSYVNGSHTYTLGGEVRQQMRSETSSGNSSGLFAFDNSFTRQYSDSTGNPQGLGLASAAFLLGLPTNTQYDYYTPYKAHDPYFAFYAQDAWRVTPKLTLSLGLRYEYEYGPVEISNREATYWDPTAALPIASASQTAYAAAFNTYKTALTTAGLSAAASALPSTLTVQGGNAYAGLNGASNRRFDNNWRLMPRIGAAYQLTSNTVVRGGYGLFYDSTNALNQSANLNGYSQITTNNLSDNFGQTWNFGDPANGVPSITDPYPVLATGSRYLTPIGNVLGSMAAVGNSYTFYAKDYKPARQQRWIAEFQQQLGNRDSVVLNYTGAFTDRLEWEQNLNAVPASVYLGGNTRNSATETALAAKYANPFYIGNFADLATSNPTLYKQMASNSFFSSSTMALSQLLKPYPWLNGLTQRTNKGQVKYHALGVQYNHRFSKGFTVTGNYQRTFQYDKDWQKNAFDTDPSWELSNTSRPSRFTGTGKLELPFGRGRRFLQDGILSKILGGQDIDFSWELQQGQLVDFNNNLIYTGDPSRMAENIKLNQPVYVVDAAKQLNYVQWLNTAYFATDNASQLGSYNLRMLPRRIDGVRSMGINNFNLNYQKTINLSERFKFTGRFECIDVFNHRTVGNPTVSATDKNFGRATNDSFAYGRWIQIQGKLTF